MSARKVRVWLLLGLGVVALGAGVRYWLVGAHPGDPRLNAFVRARPHTTVVFTSRSEAVSFAASAPEGAGFTEPGQPLWAAREGRLRLLTSRGTVHELTWGKSLPDGGTLIDVMSPTVSLDGTRVLFAGRRGDGHGRFRLYEINVDGSGLRQLTGGPDDEGCVALPPLRWRADGSLIPEAERRATDYDDVDPIELNFTDRRVLFVSSRTPDLGRDHARRSTTLWVLHADGRKAPASGNRNNDRWPFLLSSGYTAFSLWSRNREVVAEDLTDVRPTEPGRPSATPPTDAWLGAFTQMHGGHFGVLIKPQQPVWRPRPLFTNRIAFMTAFGGADGSSAGPPLTVVQAEPGFLGNVPSAQAQALPRSSAPALRRGPERDRDGRKLWLATPSPCPPSHVLLSGAPLNEGASAPEPGAFALYSANEDWPEGTADPEQIGLQVLFDDPELVDAEPVAVHAREFTRIDPAKAPVVSNTPPAELLLATGKTYRGTLGMVFATALDDPTPLRDFPGQRTDAGQEPVYDSPPKGAIDSVRIYAAHRDRFDDPVSARVAGAWEHILTVPVKAGVVAGWVPTDVPTVLAGFDRSGRVVRWETPAADNQGRRAGFYAFAGDHYSLAQANGKHFCVGCHPGHSGVSMASHNHAERLRK